MVTRRRTRSGIRQPVKPCITICPASVPTTDEDRPEAMSDTRKAAPAAGPRRGVSVR